MLDRPHVNRPARQPNSQLRPQSQPQLQPAGDSDRWRQIAIIAGAIALLVFFVLAGILFVNHNKSKDAQNPAKSAQIIKKVSSIYLLPTGEEPTVAEIKDISKLTSQVFYKDAQNGDYLMLYKQAKLALIYREKDHKLINVMPVAGNSSASEPETN